LALALALALALVLVLVLALALGLALVPMVTDPSSNLCCGLTSTRLYSQILRLVHHSPVLVDVDLRDTGIVCDPEVGGAAGSSACMSAAGSSGKQHIGNQPEPAQTGLKFKDQLIAALLDNTVLERLRLTAKFLVR
jgi:hypothetical protein